MPSLAAIGRYCGWAYGSSLRQKAAVDKFSVMHTQRRAVPRILVLLRGWTCRALDSGAVERMDVPCLRFRCC